MQAECDWTHYSSTKVWLTDAEALDQALQVLGDLRQNGRSIGIISHVSELKERITTRIEVIPQARGSIARIVGGLP